MIFEDLKTCDFVSVFENCLSVCVCVSWVSVYRTLSLFFARSLLLAPVLSSHIDQVSSLRAFYLYFAQLAFAVAV